MLFFNQVYLKGTGKECRKCVQKLNTARGFAERDKSRDVGGNHPPCDYADTFTTQDGSNMETQAEVSRPLCVIAKVQVPPCPAPFRWTIQWYSWTPRRADGQHSLAQINMR